MTNIQFKKAERKRAKARIALCAPAGGGKTHSALLIAKGLGGKIALIDTECGSAEMEAGKAGIPEFDVLRLQAPFDPTKYINAIKAAEQAGYSVIILDSLSHAWAGEGGLLDKQADIVKASRTGNSYTAWRDITPFHNRLVDTMLQSPAHILATMRSKTEYAMENDGGKLKPKKIGLAPVQREGMDYEFTIVFDIDQASHIATASKDRTSLFVGSPFTPSETTGKTIIDWLNSGKEVPKDYTKQKVEIGRLLNALDKYGATAEEAKKNVKKLTGLEAENNNLEEIINRLQVLVKEKK